MKAAIGDKHQAIIKMVKTLDQDLMMRDLPQKFSDFVSLSDTIVSQLSQSLTLDNCMELL